MPDWRTRRRRRQQNIAVDLNDELTELLDQEHALRLELGLPVADPVPPRYREQAAASVSDPISREPRRRLTVAFIWVSGLLLIAATVFRFAVVWPSEAADDCGRVDPDSARVEPATPPGVKPHPGHNKVD